MLTALQKLAHPAQTPIPSDCLQFLRQLQGPTWLECPGRTPGKPRVVVTLLHGNEPSGVRAVHHWLRSGQAPAVDTVLVLASVHTALTPPAFSQRHLSTQPDANRCFDRPGDSPVHSVAQQLTDALRRLQPQAVVDLHNTTGQNPAYGVGVGTSAAKLHITSLFASRYMNSNLQLGALMELSGVCDGLVTIECGRAGSTEADAIARQGLERFLTLPDLNLHAPVPPMSTLAEPTRITIRPEVQLTVGNQPQGAGKLVLRHDMDRHNFHPLKPGTALGWWSGTELPVAATKSCGLRVDRELFCLREGQLCTVQPMVPVMITLDCGVARSDCLFYAMMQFE